MTRTEDAIPPIPARLRRGSGLGFLAVANRPRIGDNGGMTDPILLSTGPDGRKLVTVPLDEYATLKNRVAELDFDLRAMSAESDLAHDQIGRMRTEIDKLKAERA